MFADRWCSYHALAKLLVERSRLCLAADPSLGEVRVPNFDWTLFRRLYDSYATDDKGATDSGAGESHSDASNVRD